MPVLVTAAQQPLARRVATRLLDEGGEVRITADAAAPEDGGDDGVAALRAAGAIVATATWDDVGRLDAALAEVHTLIHVGGEPLLIAPDHVPRAAEVVAAAAEGAGVSRILAVSIAGADPAANDPVRRAAGHLEARLAAAAPPSVVVRASLVDTPASRDALATAGLDAADRAVELAPVRGQDLIELLVGLDRARSRATRGHLVLAADGPERRSLGAHLERVGVTRPGSGGLTGRRLTDPDRAPWLREALLAGPWETSDPTIPSGWELTGLSPGTPEPGG